MRKILIADDEEIERNALKLILSRNFNDLILVGAAANGIEAIELAKEHQPEIILMDIKMPGIDGLKAVKEIKTFLPEAKILVVSAFGDFEYAQKALKLGVEDYLLKPVKSGMLIETLNSVGQKIEEENNKSKKVIQQKNKIENVIPFIENEILNAVIIGRGDFETFNKHMNFLDMDFFGSAFCMVVNVGQEDNKKEIFPSSPKYDAKSTKEIVMEYANEVTQCLACELTDYNILLLVPVNINFDILSARMWSRELAEYLQGKIYGKTRRDVKIGIGDVHEGYESFHNSFLEAMRALRQYESRQAITHFCDINATESSELFYPYDLEKELCNNLIKGSEQESFLLLDKIIDSLYKNYYEKFDLIRSKLYELVVVLQRQVAVNCGLNMDTDAFFQEMGHIKDLEQLSGWTRGALKKMLVVVESRQQGNANSILSAAVKYINQNYCKDLTLEAVAYEVNVSSFYLSKLFKQKLDQNFIDFITEKRIEKAKALLRDTNKNVKEITYEVGYNNQNYFSRVFKKIVGMSAKQYKELNSPLDNIQ